MTDGARTERIVAEWLADTAQPRVPEWFDEMLEITATTRQRPAWSIPERWIPMATLTRSRVTLAPVPWRTIGLLAVLLLALAAALFAAGSRTRVPAPFGPAANGLVAYSAGGDIYTVDPVTGAQVAIVTGPENDYGPRWSRDGTRVAFLRSDRPGTARLFVARSDGRDVQALTPEPFVTVGNADETDVDVYEFAPDGQSVMFVSSVDGLRMISIVDLDGASRTIDVGMSVRTATWRPPSGDEIAFISYDPNAGGLFVAKPDRKDVRTLVEVDSEYNLYDAAWSPDGTRIAYSRWGGPEADATGLSLRVRLVAADGTNERGIAASPESAWETAPAWSNDGTRLAVRRGYDDTGEDTTLVVVPADGGGREVETDRSLGECCGGHEWTPDDTAIVASTGAFSGEASIQVVIDPLTGATRVAPWSAGSPPSWQRLAP